VVRIDARTNAVYVGPRDAVMLREFVVRGINWLNAPVPLLAKEGEERPASFRASVKVRSMMKDEPATLFLADEKVRVVYDEPQWAPAPGQSAVFYDGEVVLGGGVISVPSDS
jgi:tRNA-specific 2-thiouridylase